MKATKFLIILNTLIFISVFALPEPLFSQTFEIFSVSSASLLNGSFWTIITAMFLHASASHLFFNMLGLHYFGNVVEEKLGSKSFLLVYFAGGVIGDLFYCFFTPGPSAVGASGAIFGILGAAMLLNPSKSIDLYIFPLPVGIIGILYTLIQITFFTLQLEGLRTVVGYSAHIGGLAGGSTLTFLMKPFKSIRGVIWLMIFAIMLVYLYPYISIIIGIGGFILNIIDSVVGFVLYGLAGAVKYLVFG